MKEKVRNQVKGGGSKIRLLLQAASCLALLCGCAEKRNDSLDQNKKLVRHYFEGWANRGDPAVADELIATNIVLSNPPAVVHGLADYKQGMTAFHKAFPDLKFTIEDEIAEGNRVAVRWTMRGTQLGEYQGRPPTGRTATVTGISIFQLADRKIQEITVSMDRLGQVEQLGCLTAARQPTK